MKLILLLIPFLLNAWTITERDINNMSDEQKEVLTVAYLVGKEKGQGLGIKLQAITIVENMARMKDNNPNHICGPQQVDIRYAKASCEALESNPYYSAKLALANLLDWRTKTLIRNGKKVFKTRSWDEVYRMYNVGYTRHPHGPVYVSKVKKTIKLLKEMEKKQNEKSIYLWFFKGW